MADRLAVILGGLGFIGTHLAGDLLQRGWKVRIIDWMAGRPPSGLDCWSEHLELVDLPISNTKALLTAVTGAEICVHLAHNSRPNAQVKSFASEMREVVFPTHRLLAGLGRQAVKKFLYFSSGGTVYGLARRLPIDESHPTWPRSNYGWAKLLMEIDIRYFYRRQGIQSLILRPANVYGSSWFLERPQGAVEVFLRAILTQKPIEIMGDGSAIRDYIHIQDVLAALRLTMDYDRFATWNLGSGQGYSLLDLVSILEQATSRKTTVITCLANRQDVPVNILDAGALRQATGWRPQISLEQGIAGMLRQVNSKLVSNDAQGD